MKTWISAWNPLPPPVASDCGLPEYSMCGPAIFCSAEEKGIKSTCILRKLSLSEFLFCNCCSVGIEGLGKFFLPVFLFVFVTLQVLQIFSYLDFALSAWCFWC